jgi:hypothetical protein
LNTPAIEVRTCRFTIEPEQGWIERARRLLHPALIGRCGIHDNTVLDRVEACVLALAEASIVADGGDMSIGLIRDERLLRVELADNRANRTEPAAPQVVGERADSYGWELNEPTGAHMWCTFLLVPPDDGPVIA